jgi:hypothetical protein
MYEIDRRRCDMWEEIRETGAYRYAPDGNFEVRCVGDDPHKFELVNRATQATYPLSFASMYQALDQAAAVLMLGQAP